MARGPLSLALQIKYFKNYPDVGFYIPFIFNIFSSFPYLYRISADSIELKPAFSNLKL